MRNSSVTKKVMIAACAMAMMAGLLAIRADAIDSLASESTQAPVRSAGSLYSKHCASCHGKDGRSKTLKAKFNQARNLADPQWQEAVSDERIFNSIANGRGKMPAFSKKMSEAEIDAMVLHVRALKAHAAQAD